MSVRPGPARRRRRRIGGASQRVRPVHGEPGWLSGTAAPERLADVIEVILDKGLVIDAYVRVSLVGIELVTIDARIVVASVDTYLRFAEAVSWLDLLESDDSKGLPDALGGGLQEGAAKAVTKGAIEGFEEVGLGGRDD